MIPATKGKDFEILPAGSYVARCYEMIHIGTVSTPYGDANKVRLGFELPNDKKVFKEENGEQPLVISAEYTLSTHPESNLGKTLVSWRGKSFTQEEEEKFDVENVLGVPCMITVTHKTSKTNGKTYANIASISPLPKGMECPAQINETKLLNYEKFDEALFESLPDFLKEKIQSSDEYQLMKNPIDVTAKDESYQEEVNGEAQVAGDINPDDIPF